MWRDLWILSLVGSDLGGVIRSGHPGWTGWGPYEHTPPSQWRDGQNTSESYRRCCTSVGWVAFVNEMWAKHRPTLPAPTDGWKQPHDDAYYRTAITKSQK